MLKLDQYLIPSHYMEVRPSIFSAAFDDFRSDYYSPNTAGASSAFVCAESSIFSGKPLKSASKSCLNEVFVGPVGSIGFAPWPWLGTYAIYNGWDLNLGISLKPIKEIAWTVSIELVGPIAGINPGTDRHMNFSTCPEDNYSFSACRTRLGYSPTYHSEDQREFFRLIDSTHRVRFCLKLCIEQRL